MLTKREQFELRKTGKSLCRYCQEIKDLSEFYLRQDGVYNSYCKPCYSLMQKEYRKNNPDFVEARREYSRKNGKERRKENPEEVREYHRNYYKKNKKKICELQKKYASTYEGKKKKTLKHQRRRSKINKAKVEFISLASVTDRFLSFGNRCVYCRCFQKMTVDHVVPISKGGSHTIKNIVPACQSCNSSKNDNDWKKWYRRQTFYRFSQEVFIQEMMK